MPKTYIKFEQTADTGLTKVWAVRSTQYGSVLGEVKWFGKWCRYCFFPVNAIFDASCLEQITEFIRIQMGGRDVQHDLKKSITE